MSTYDTHVLTAIGLEMEKDTKGMVPNEVARAWAAAEQGVNGNVYGVTAGGKLRKFSTWQAGVAAAANLLMTGAPYKAIWQRLVRLGGNDIPGAATAIAQAPWRLGVIGLAKAGGTDPYYQRVFAYYGLFNTEPPSPNGGGDTSIAPLVHVSLDAPSSDTYEYGQQLFAIEAGQPFSGTWPSEATNPANRLFAITQHVAAAVAGGPAFTNDPLLSCAQVVWAFNRLNEHSAWGIYDVFATALARAASVAQGRSGALPWPTDPASKVVVAQTVGGGAGGIASTSGWYGTGKGVKPS